jgi:adenylate cyclase
VRSPLDEVVQNLSQDPNLLRIKKLLIYASRQTWERDPITIQQADLYPLVQDLRAKYPTRQILEAHLTAVVNTLSKVTEYTLVANAALSYLEPLYPANESLAIAASSQDYHQVAAQLEQDANASRIKKLLFAACTQTWENDPQVLSQHPLVELVQRLHRLTATPQTLDAILTSIVRTLNRQTEYTRVAQTIIYAFAPLYGDLLEVTQANLSAPTLSPTDETRIHGSVTPPYNAVRSIAMEPPAAVSPAPPVGGYPSTSAAQTPLKLDDATVWVDLRLTLMKFSNPLRAKLLLYAVLYDPLPPGLQAWTHLKGYDLDTLLKQLWQRYDSLGALSTDLGKAADLLSDLESVGDRPASQHANLYQPVASALLRAFQPFYSSAVGTAAGSVTAQNLDEKGDRPACPAPPSDDPTGIIRNPELS